MLMKTAQLRAQLLEWTAIASQLFQNAVDEPYGTIEVTAIGESTIVPGRSSFILPIWSRPFRSISLPRSMRAILSSPFSFTTVIP